MEFVEVILVDGKFVLYLDFLFCIFEVDMVYINRIIGILLGVKEVCYIINVIVYLSFEILIYCCL